MKQFNKLNLIRNEQVYLAQLRCDAFSKLGKYYYLLNKNKNITNTCRLCYQNKETILHIFNECKNDNICCFRNDLILHYQNPSDALVDYKHPKYAISFIEKILLYLKNSNFII